MTNIQHSSENDRWLTPQWICDLAKNWLGEIDLDPASEAEANLKVGAKRFITQEEDGLVVDWGRPKTIFLNPPGGMLPQQYKGTFPDCRSLPQAFMLKMIENLWSYRKDGGTCRPCAAVYVGFSIEQLMNFQRIPLIKEFLECCTILIPNERVKFDLPKDIEFDEEGKHKRLDKNGKPKKNQPSHANFILLYESSNFDRSAKTIDTSNFLVLRTPESAV